MDIGDRETPVGQREGAVIQHIVDEDERREPHNGGGDPSGDPARQEMLPSRGEFAAQRSYDEGGRRCRDADGDRDNDNAAVEETFGARKVHGFPVELLLSSADTENVNADRDGANPVSYTHLRAHE